MKINDFYHVDSNILPETHWMDEGDNWQPNEELIVRLASYDEYSTTLRAIAMGEAVSSLTMTVCSSG